MGAHAEYVCLPEDGSLAVKPSNMTYEEAATVPIGGLNALHFLRKAAIQPGERVLNNGAGGSIGTYGVQLANHFGAEVTAVDRGEKLDMLRAIGADHVIDYTQEDFTDHAAAYDVIFDIIGTSPYARSLHALRPNGRYLLANTGPAQMLRGVWTSRRSDKKVIFEMAAEKAEDQDGLRSLIEAGTLRAVIDRRYPLAALAEAHRYIEKGLKQGNVVVTMDEEVTA
jgi:NADPH:quinone reductase-like Zn-dependent oxidoreductase